jgi:alpha-beta hydrolase superfamily lysophospholipase
MLADAIGLIATLTLIQNLSDRPKKITRLMRAIQTKNFTPLRTTATVLLLLLLSASPTMADVCSQNHCIEATETHLPVYVWQQAGRRPKGVVLLLHGIVERAQSLNHLAQQLVSDDFLVYALDERGHGWWHFHQKEGAPGYKCDFKRTVHDVDKLLSVLRKEHPDLPVFLIGESVGAAIAWRAAVDRPDAVDGIVAAATGTKTGHVNMKWFMGDILRSCCLWHHQINVVRYQLKYGTDDLQSFEETLKDPEQRKTLTLCEMIGSVTFLHKNLKFARRLSPHIALLVIQGGDDQVLSPKSARKVFDAANTLNKRFVLVPGSGHVLLGMNRQKPLVHEAITIFLNEVVLRHEFVTRTSETSESTPSSMTAGASSQLGTISSFKGALQ